MRHFRATGQDVCVRSGLTLRHPLGRGRKGRAMEPRAKDARPGSRGDPRQGPEAAVQRAAPVGRLHPRQAVHALRLRELRRRPAARGRRGRQVAAHPLRLVGPVGHHGPRPLELRRRRPAERPARRPGAVRLHRRGRRAPRGDPAHRLRLHPLPAARGGSGGAPRRPLHRRLHPAPRRADAGLSRLRQLVLPRRLPRTVRRPRADLRPDLRRRRRPSHLRRRRELGPPRGLSRREARRPGAGEQEPAYHDHRQRDAARRSPSPAFPSS